jgi:hypothetical protein
LEGVRLTLLPAPIGNQSRLATQSVSDRIGRARAVMPSFAIAKKRYPNIQPGKLIT